MTTKVACVLLVLFISNYAGGNPVSSEKQPAEYGAYRDSKLIQATSRDSPRFRQSWSFPSLPSLPSVGSFFRDDDDRLNSLRKRVDALEKAQKELLSLLEQTKEAGKPEACNCRKQESKELEGAKSKTGPATINKAEKEGAPGQSPIKGDTQSALGTTKPGQMNAPTPAKKSPEAEESLSPEASKEDVKVLQEQSQRETAPFQEANQAEAPANPEEGKTPVSGNVEKLGKSKAEEENAVKTSGVTSDTTIQAEPIDTEKEETAKLSNDGKPLNEEDGSKNSSPQDALTNEERPTDAATSNNPNMEQINNL